MGKDKIDVVIIDNESVVSRILRDFFFNVGIRSVEVFGSFGEVLLKDFCLVDILILDWSLVNGDSEAFFQKMED